MGQEEEDALKGPKIGDEYLFDAERGIFTKGDRRYLLNEKEYSSRQAERNKHQDIRRRLKMSIYDLNMLRFVSGQDRNLLFKKDRFDTILQGGISSLITFAHAGLNGNTEFLEIAVMRGILNAEQGMMEGYEGDSQDVEVTIELKQDYDAEGIFQRYQRGGPDALTPQEIGILVREGYLDSEDLEQLKWERAE